MTQYKEELCDYCYNHDRRKESCIQCRGTGIMEVEVVLKSKISLEEQARALWDAAQNKGTPKTLQQAIQNATHDFFQLDEAKMLGELTLESIIYSHVKDFLAQKFQLYMLGDGTVIDSTAQAIWEKIIGIGK